MNLFSGVALEVTLKLFIPLICLSTILPSLSMARDRDSANNSRFETQQDGEWFNDLEPSLITAVAEGPKGTQHRCELISQRAERQQIKVMIIAFEGLISTDAHANHLTYVYRQQLLDGVPEQQRSPIGTIAPIPGEINNQLAAPLVTDLNGRFEYINVPHDSQWVPGVGGADSIATTCARQWLKDSDPSKPSTAHRKLIVVGHSMGGIAFAALATTLAQENLKIDLGITIDALAPENKPPGVNKWVNFRAIGILGGLTGSDADANVFVPEEHIFAVGDPQIRQLIENQVRAWTATDAVVKPASQAVTNAPKNTMKKPATHAPTEPSNNGKNAK